MGVKVIPLGELLVEIFRKESCYRTVDIVRGAAGGKVRFDPNISLEMMEIEKAREVWERD